MSNKSEFRPLIRKYQALGWTVEPTRGSHLKWTAPDGGIAFSASTPSDGRAVKNHEALLQRLSKQGRAH